MIGVRPASLPRESITLFLLSPHLWLAGPLTLYNEFGRQSRCSNAKSADSTTHQSSSSSSDGANGIKKYFADPASLARCAPSKPHTASVDLIAAHSIKKRILSTDGADYFAPASGSADTATVSNHLTLSR